MDWQVEHVEAWDRTRPQPVILHQRFATSGDSKERKRQFVSDLPGRRLGNGLLVICGESNIASLSRSDDDFFDPFEFNARLDSMGIRVIFNPLHDYMRRYEMPRKRQYYSANGRTVLSVWNQGKGREAHLPWTVFHNGQDAIELVEELEPLFPERTDIRIGVVTVPRQRR